MKWPSFSTGSRFFLSFILMILVARVFIFFTHMNTPDIGSFDVHHYMIGLALIITGIVVSSVEIYGVGLGLLLDEWSIFFPALFPVEGWQIYFSAKYTLGVAVCIVLVFLLREKLVKVAAKT
jgi:hypothetical protein